MELRRQAVSDTACKLARLAQLGNARSWPNLTQPHHAEFGSDVDTIVGFERDVFATTKWIMYRRLSVMKQEKATYLSLFFAHALKRRRDRNHLFLSIIAAAISALAFSTFLNAQSAKPSAYEVEAAYIYAFGKYAKWPATAAANQNNSFTICVLGVGPFDSILQSTLAGKSLDGRPVSFRSIPNPRDATGCHILFIDSTEESHLRTILDALGQAAVLTVSDMPDFSKRGGMIQFVLQGDRIRFAINRRSAEGSGLTLASDLLKVATSVIGTGRTGGQ